MQSFSSALSSDAIYLQGIVGVLLLSVAVGIMVVGDMAIWHLGVGSSIFAAVLGIGLTTVYLLSLSIQFRKTFLRTYMSVLT